MFLRKILTFTFSDMLTRRTLWIMKKWERLKITRVLSTQNNQCHRQFFDAVSLEGEVQGWSLSLCLRGCLHMGYTGASKLGWSTANSISKLRAAGFQAAPRPLPPPWGCLEMLPSSGMEQDQCLPWRRESLGSSKVLRSAILSSLPNKHGPFITQEWSYQATFLPRISLLPKTDKVGSRNWSAGMKTGQVNPGKEMHRPCAQVCAHSPALPVTCTSYTRAGGWKVDSVEGGSRCLR